MHYKVSSKQKTMLSGGDGPAQGVAGKSPGEPPRSAVKAKDKGTPPNRSTWSDERYDSRADIACLDPTNQSESRTASRDLGKLFCTGIARVSR